MNKGNKKTLSSILVPTFHLVDSKAISNKSKVKTYNHKQSNSIGFISSLKFDANSKQHTDEKESEYFHENHSQKNLELDLLKINEPLIKSSSQASLKNKHINLKINSPNAIEQKINKFLITKFSDNNLKIPAKNTKSQSIPNNGNISITTTFNNYNFPTGINSNSRRKLIERVGSPNKIQSNSSPKIKISQPLNLDNESKLHESLKEFLKLEKSDNHTLSIASEITKNIQNLDIQIIGKDFPFFLFLSKCVSFWEQAKINFEKLAKAFQENMEKNRNNEKEFEEYKKKVKDSLGFELENKALKSNINSLKILNKELELKLDNFKEREEKILNILERIQEQGFNVEKVLMEFMIDEDKKLKLNPNKQKDKGKEKEKGIEKESLENYLNKSKNSQKQKKKEKNEILIELPHETFENDADHSSFPPYSVINDSDESSFDFQGKSHEQSTLLIIPSSQHLKKMSEETKQQLSLKLELVTHSDLDDESID